MIFSPINFLNTINTLKRVKGSLVILNYFFILNNNRIKLRIYKISAKVKWILDQIILIGKFDFFITKY